QQVYGKPLIEKVQLGWKVLFPKRTGPPRFGYLQKIDHERRQVQVIDLVAYPNAPAPLSALVETIPFEQVLMACQGFSWIGEQAIFEGEKRAGKRQVAILVPGRERDATVGWLAHKRDRVYVGRWDRDRGQIREENL